MRAYLLLMLVVLLFAGNILVGKAAAELLPPFTLALGRVLIATLVVLIFLGPRAWRARRRILPHWRGLLVIALSGVGLFNAFLYSALHHTSATNVAVLEAAIPVVTAACMALFFSERLRPRQWLGVIISVLGTVWVVSNGHPERIIASWGTGEMIMLAAIGCWVIYTLAVRRWMADLPFYTSLVPLMLLATLALTPPAIVEQFGQAQRLTLESDALWALLYLGLGPSLVALVLYNRAVLEVGPSRASIFLNLLPLVTMAGGAWLLGAPVTPAQVMGAVIVMTGVSLVVAERRPGRRSPAR
ncbi:DMT family transporter [Kushneria indalinina]|uniref:Drug/metabolite transporter (DMT)-like permease n=1 Tax=Kushneria indalinina DSM 14324 TaxID=1122140 RepID=A0A3D9DXL2_9GAMM|nr:DMT family transporter [Kushneria indalinina]REC95520.1 drug/metabolite transporter (DMT)-like permease [Kushneria indalinina DSM 14324]